MSVLSHLEWCNTWLVFHVFVTFSVHGNFCNSRMNPSIRPSLRPSIRVNTLLHAVVTSDLCRQTFVWWPCIHCKFNVTSEICKPSKEMFTWLPWIGTDVRKRSFQSLTHGKCLMTLPTLSMDYMEDIDGSVQDCSISIANALEILQSCTKPSMVIRDVSVADLCNHSWPSPCAPRTASLMVAS